MKSLWVSAGCLAAALAGGWMLASCQGSGRASKPSARSARPNASSAASAASPRTSVESAPARPWLHGRTATPAPPADARSVIS
ncbi:MAG TPA: hypothetical protein VMS65_17390, partial [Polyangiaceae bacterium]|nr:hypothetical protein [Polyangiaceae bacterium]